jgi:peptidoglycan L-alanyl-D-glutamate endopeptidase CwlK
MTVPLYVASTPLSRIDVMKLYPPFLAALQSLLDAAHGRGADFFVVSGFRTYAEQSALYFQGRTSAGTKVTNAQAGQSPHNFGIAADLCRDADANRAGLQPDYRPEEYEILRELAPKYGLVWGGSWEKFPDRPHVQMPNYITATQLEPLKYCYELGGLINVFTYLDKGTP